MVKNYVVKSYGTGQTVDLCPSEKEKRVKREIGFFVNFWLSNVRFNWGFFPHFPFMCCVHRTLLLKLCGFHKEFTSLFISVVDIS